MHARHTTYNGFTNICALWTVKEQKPETFPSRVRTRLWTFPLWDLSLAPSVPACGPPHLQLEGQSDTGKTIFLRSRAWPEPLLGEPSVSQLVSGLFW